MGVPPGEPNKVSVVAQVNRPMSSTITFRNPFLETIHALIVLESKCERGECARKVFKNPRGIESVSELTSCLVEGLPSARGSSVCAAHVSICLDGVFSLLNKKARVQIGPLGTTQIPFSFCPPSMTQHAAEIAVSVVKPNLTWTYAIQGMTAEAGVWLETKACRKSACGVGQAMVHKCV
eukprot:3123655-Amphidinium_carterae.1